MGKCCKNFKCPECEDGFLELRNSRYGKFYGCENYPSCKAAHGAHPDGRPLGVPANKETKQARIQAHNAFDGFWRGRMTRSKAYLWLQDELRMTAEECHIGRFDIFNCNRVIAIVAVARRQEEKTRLGVPAGHR